MTVKNRGWVKNVAIIFLAVLLVLTFFSNTIMNYSLPEVSGGYYGGGSIRSAIRGQGEVIANMSYNVQLSETREIKSVHIKAGDHVEAGQVIFTLEESDSEELQTAIRELEDLNLALSKKLVQMRPADYGADNREIELLQEEIAELEEGRQISADHAQALLDAKQAVKDAQAVVDALADEQAVIEENIASLASTDELDYERLLTERLRKLRRDLEDAIQAEKAAEKALKQAEEDFADQSGGDSSLLAGLIAQMSAKEAEVMALESAIATKKTAVLALIDAEYGVSASPPQEYLDYSAQPDDEAVVNALLAVAASDASLSNDIKTGISDYGKLESDLSHARATLRSLEAEYNITQPSNASITRYKEAVTAAKIKLEKAKEAVEAAQKAYDRELKALSLHYKDALAIKKAEVKAAQSVLDDIKEAQTELAEREVMTPDEINAAIKKKQREIEEKLFALGEKKGDDRVDSALADLDLQGDRRAINDQEEIIEKLRGKAEGSEVTARYAGMITAVNCIAGDKVEAGSDLASLDIEGKGFSVSFSVTNEQAQKLRIGDNSSISRYWGESILVTLSAIRNDPQSGGRQKILEFTVDGEVSVGEQLNITIGERDQNYECVLPNSAIREDADGKYILIAEVKNTPLGSRYTAVRIDVAVLAKDDVNSAIARDTYNNEYVITTATKPVEPGTQVRLVGG